MLYRLAQQDKFTPQKYFSIDKVFRNETLGNIVNHSQILLCITPLFDSR